MTIGEVLRPYGLRGEVKVRPLTDRPRERFKAHMSCTLWEPVGDRREPCRIAACRFEPKALPSPSLDPTKVLPFKKPEQ